MEEIGDHSYLKAYRGNRFNIPFENGADVYYHHFVPKKNPLHHALYDTVSEEVEFNTRQALSIVLHNMHVCIVRQLEDHLLARGKIPCAH